MIESISERISGYVYHHNDRQHVSREVMKFALIGIILNTVTVLLSLCIGLLDGKFSETCIALAAMAALRFLAGGHHLRSPVLCIVVSTAAVTAVPFITISEPLIYGCTLISGLLIWKYAPVDFKNKTRISDKSLSIMKYSGMLLVGSNLLIHSNILAVSWLIVALTLITLRGGETHE
jgi:accessory gene regulator B